MLVDTERSSDTMAFRFRSIVMTGNDSIPLQRVTSLLKQRSQYTYTPNSAEEQHDIPAIYIGTRLLSMISVDITSAIMPENGLSCQVSIHAMNRKLQIRACIPQSDVNANRVIQHYVNVAELEDRAIEREKDGVDFGK